jgi:hypothetical protein
VKEAVDIFRKYGEPLPPIGDMESFGTMFDRLRRCQGGAARRSVPRHIGILPRAGCHHATADRDARLQHLSNASVTVMDWQGEFNIGELCRTACKSEAVLIGFSMVAAADDWDEPIQVKTVLPRLVLCSQTRRGRSLVTPT